jgi:hypothetical protein
MPGVGGAAEVPAESEAAPTDSRPNDPEGRGPTDPGYATNDDGSWDGVTERRSGKERRSGRDRRQEVDLVFKNRRFGKDRRSGKERRKNWPPKA